MVVQWRKNSTLSASYPAERSSDRATSGGCRFVDVFFLCPTLFNRPDVLLPAQEFVLNKKQREAAAAAAAASGNGSGSSGASASYRAW